MLEDDKLEYISEQLDKGVIPSSESVRSFLTWFGAYRREYNVVRHIRSKLAMHNLRTAPDFEFAYIDSQIRFERAKPTDAEEELRDPTYRIGSLESANQPPRYVSPQAPLSEVVTLMLTHNYSQIPVMTSERDVKGVINWKSLGSRLALNGRHSEAQDLMEPSHIVGEDEPLLSAM
jgi:signal-transduction protein with cAMP-binding, CBS, and nucleotidyltransferase domain